MPLSILNQKAKRTSLERKKTSDHVAAGSSILAVTDDYYYYKKKSQQQKGPEKGVGMTTGTSHARAHIRFKSMGIPRRNRRIG